MSYYKNGKPIEPTQSTYSNPYESNPYKSSITTDQYGLPIIKPPPPPKQRHPLRWIIIIAVVLIIIGASLYIGYAIGHVGNSHNTSISTVSPTARNVKTPMPATPTTQTSPSSILTASVLYNDFANANLPVASPSEISDQWWSSVDESYYPLQGGVQFTDTRSNALLQIAVFNSAQAATTDVQDATRSPDGWAAQTIQVNTCVLFSNEGPINIQYYKPIMQKYCSQAIA
jgi:hypothetical protein